jgi:hypothetical protein
MATTSGWRRWIEPFNRAAAQWPLRRLAPTIFVESERPLTSLLRLQAGVGQRPEWGQIRSTADAYSNGKDAPKAAVRMPLSERVKATQSGQP